MTYRELLKLYRTGELDDDARAKVERDIEKQDAISEYLCEEGEIPGLEELGGNTEPDGENEALVATIRRTIRRSFIKLGVTVTAVVLVCAACAVFVLPKAVDHLFYQPNEPVGHLEDNHDVATTRFTLDMAVWTELFMPGHYRSSANAEPRGYGVYDVAVPQNASVDGRYRTLTGRLTRGELFFYDGDALKRPVDNAFYLPEGLHGNNIFVSVDGTTGQVIPMEEERALAFKYLRDRKDSGWLQGYVSFNEIMDFPSVLQWLKDSGLEGPEIWLGVYTEDEYQHHLTHNMGMNLGSSGMCHDWDREKYPYLSLLDNNDWTDHEDEEVMTAHFVSMLRYLMDYPELYELFGNGRGQIADFTQAIDYIEKNGLQFYGIAVVTDKEQLLALEDDPTVGFLSVSPY